MNSKLKRLIGFMRFGFLNLLVCGALAAVSTACTSTAARTDGVEEPLDPSLTEDPQIFGTIDEDYANYQWTGKEYEDKRFAAELDNSPLRPYEPSREDSWAADGVTGSNVEKTQSNGANKTKKLRKKSKKRTSGTQVR